MTRILQGLVRIMESKVVILGHVGVIWVKMAKILQGLVIIVEIKIVSGKKWKKFCKIW